ncbi:hypothetical protein ALP08_102774 [Pseudomonas syringae pv. pisi]|uniref:Uncharacterized protein n=1 Tax=Pseudomonas syringae pv. pisi TaxID=59510 RepID=A0A3M6E363_PSESJ|nr:hypothetical protein ALQ44_102559 [Pseudomonas syringae pv. pisi]RMV62737.1 hypothetical protein ALP08_102774 [Pseudomonas syringae pv. pisi]
MAGSDQVFIDQMNRYRPSESSNGITDHYCHFCACLKVYTLATDDCQNVAVGLVHQMVCKRLFDLKAFDQVIGRSTEQLAQIAQVLALMALDKCLSCSADGLLIIHIR